MGRRGVINELITIALDWHVKILWSDWLALLEKKKGGGYDLWTVQTRRMKTTGAENFATALVITFPLISTGTHCVHAGRCQSMKHDNAHLEKASKWIHAWNQSLSERSYVGCKRGAKAELNKRWKVCYDTPAFTDVGSFCRRAISRYPDIDPWEQGSILSHCVLVFVAQQPAIFWTRWSWHRNRWLCFCT